MESTVFSGSKMRIKKEELTIPNASKNAEQQKCSFIGWWECKTVQLLWKTVYQVVTKLNILLTYNLAIALPNEAEKFTQMKLKNYVHTKTCTSKFCV